MVLLTQEEEWNHVASVLLFLYFATHFVAKRFSVPMCLPGSTVFGAVFSAAFGASSALAAGLVSACRFSTVSGMSGCAAPLTTRSFDCSVAVAASTLVKDVGGRCLAAIGQRAGILDQPAVAVMDPDILAETAVGIEDPRADAAGCGGPSR